MIQWRRCPLCQVENPPNAFFCLSCYHGLKGKPQTSFLHMRLPWSVSALTLAVCLVWLMFEGVKGWMNAAQAQIEASLTNEQYLALQRMELRQRSKAVEEQAPLP